MRGHNQYYKDQEDGTHVMNYNQVCIQCSWQPLQMPINDAQIWEFALSCRGKKPSCLEGQEETSLGQILALNHHALQPQSFQAGTLCHKKSPT